MKETPSLIKELFGNSLVDELFDILETIHDNESSDEDIIDCEIIEHNNLIEFKGDSNEQCK